MSNASLKVISLTGATLDGGDCEVFVSSDDDWLSEVELSDLLMVVDSGQTFLCWREDSIVESSSSLQSKIFLLDWSIVDDSMRLFLATGGGSLVHFASTFPRLSLRERSLLVEIVSSEDISIVVATEM